MTSIPPRPGSMLPRIMLAVAALVTAIAGTVLVSLGLDPASRSVFPDQNLTKIAGLGFTVAGMAALAWAVFRKGTTSIRWGAVGRIKLWLEKWTERDDALTIKQRALNLFLISFLALFFELALIRWLAAEIKVFAYLKNVILIAAFLGLGMGYFISRHRTGLLPLFLPSAALLISTVTAGAALGVWQKIYLPNGDQLVLLGLTFRGLRDAPLLLQFITWIPYYSATVFFFVFVVLLFIPLGQYSGKCMRAFAPIPGYSLNLLGSLAGTLAFTLFSFVWLPPTIWFALTALASIFLLRATVGSLRRLNWALTLGFVLLIGYPDSTVWSPYHNLNLIPRIVTEPDGNRVQWGYRLSIGTFTYQELLDFSPGFFKKHPNLLDANQGSQYWVAYQFIHPKDVLVLGAGTGNDVAAALRFGATSVDAVDIDPAILQMGQQYHPEQPYESSNVTLIADDARSFVRKSTKSYDLVAFGFLDSQQVLSALGSARLDNFVYTVEGMRDAFELVRPNGVLTVSFLVFEPWISERMSGILENATGQKPIIIQAANDGTVFLVRKGSAFSQPQVRTALQQLGSEASQVTLNSTGLPLTTDDWPFLYLRDRGMPFAYLTMLPLLALVAIVMLRRVFATERRVQWHFFFLGAAFMLMEVRIISQISLLFGSTWIVNVVAVASILLMAILANLLVAWKKIESIFAWGGLLLVAVMVSSLVPMDFFLNWDFAVGGAVAALVLALPVFFASVVFSISFRQSAAVDIGLASNLSGSILGGFAEYFSLLGGLGSLACIAAICYVLALATASQQR